MQMEPLLFLVAIASLMYFMYNLKLQASKRRDQRNSELSAHLKRLIKGKTGAHKRGVTVGYLSADAYVVKVNKNNNIITRRPQIAFVYNKCPEDPAEGELKSLARIDKTTRIASEDSWRTDIDIPTNAATGDFSCYCMRRGEKVIYYNDTLFRYTSPRRDLVYEELRSSDAPDTLMAIAMCVLPLSYLFRLIRPHFELFVIIPSLILYLIAWAASDQQLRFHTLYFSSIYYIELVFVDV